MGIMKSENEVTIKTFYISLSGTFTANLKLLKSQRLSDVAQAIEIGPQAALYLCVMSLKQNRVLEEPLAKNA